MDDKIFNLITKLYSEFKEFRKETDERFTKIENNITKIENNITKIENNITKIEINIENEIKPNIKASLEGYQMVYEKQKEHDKWLENIDKKLEKQDVEIAVIKGGIKKKVK